ncbi:TetR/AcrR family transcriptional regulator [Kineococcus sp. SYSU DK005]|uniref:TetR/AcrR family transcriptional regulator n=1 Tax=Kineococcus sp. SYSU DK005 TaxID=3383126 RepID=UPI003D7CD441
MRKGKPNDPQRRARILHATLAVIGEEGVHATSHRRVAARAEVPLGSMTYYFADLETLIVTAFETLRAGLQPLYATPLHEARTQNEAIEALVAATCGASSPSRHAIRLYTEMYHYAGRSPRVAELVRSLQEESLEVLRHRFSDSAARAVDALIWGWWTYRSFHDTPLDEGMVHRAFWALVTDLADDTGVGSARPTAAQHGARPGASEEPEDTAQGPPRSRNPSRRAT